MNRIFFFTLSLLILTSCNSETETGSRERPTGNQINIVWENLGNHINGQNHFKGRYTIQNYSGQPMPKSGWAIYFNQLVGAPLRSSFPTTIKIEHISGDFYKIVPTDQFPGIPSLETFTFELLYSGSMIKESAGPTGTYIVFEDGKAEPEKLGGLRILPFTSPEQINRGPNDEVPIPTPEWLYQQNKLLSKLPPDQVPPMVPTPVSISYGADSIALNKQWKIHSQKNLQQEIRYLRGHLQQLLGGAPVAQTSNEPGKDVIMLSIDPSSFREGQSEAYRLSINKETGIQIFGSDKQGLFYGIQSLLAILPPKQWKGAAKSIIIPETEVQDAPRYRYRGLHLDVSRNFHSKASVLKLLDLMAFYKLNRFHFHLTDDEGWRLEIPDLPELTTVGARRGHTTDEKDHLHPSYGSGPFPDPATSLGSGFYTTKDFVEILRHATNRHIEVIPEFDMPGHARAAIKSMQTRSDKTYRLDDPEDKSVYTSVQGYSDNVVCPCQESTFAFLEKVVSEVQKMYKEAGAPLKSIHVGGDEVPEGVWEKSPACQELLSSNTELQGTKDLFPYFIERFHQILQDKGLITAGWEEIAIKKEQTEQGMAHIPNPKLAEGQVRPYVWTEYWTNEALVNRLANDGFEVVLCNVSNLYFDLAYNKDPDEPGLYWGGFVDAFQVYRFTPENIFYSTTTNAMGQKLDMDRFEKDMPGLDNTGRSNILGIQGQIWSETLREPLMLDYYVLPKLIALSERAWAAQPNWANTKDATQREKALKEEWNIFANQIGQREIPRLDHIFGGFNFRTPPPGAILEDGMLKANIAYPGLEIRYSIGKEEPHRGSPLYNGPVEAQPPIKVKAFNTRGSGSQSVIIKMNQGN